MNRLHPLAAFSYYAGSLIMLAMFRHPVFLAAGFFALILVHLIADRCTELRRWRFFMLTSGALALIANPVFNERGRRLLFEIAGHRVTFEAVVLGAMSGLLIMAVIALFISYNEIMTPNKLLFLFAKIMPQFAVLLMLTLRFIPLMRRRLGEIAAIQTSKGISVRGGPLRDRAKNGMRYVHALLVFSLEEAIQTADSMKARGYGDGKRTSYHRFRFRKADAVTLGLLSVLFAAASWGRIAGLGTLAVYPTMEPFWFHGQEAALFGAFIVFLTFPALIELKGALKWRS